MDHLIGGSSDLGWIAVEAVLLYVTAVLGFRIGHRRTLTDLSPIDFVAAIAVGSIVGRVPNASDASYLAGMVTLVAVLATHAALNRLRRFPSVSHLISPAPRLLVARGQILDEELRRCGLTEGDLHALLRRQGVARLEEVRYAVLEPRGHLSVIRMSALNADAEPELLREIVAARAGAGA